MDIRKIARHQFTEAAATADCRDLAKAVLEMATALQTIASVPINTPEPLQVVCSSIAGRMLEKWTGEKWIWDEENDTAFPPPTNRSPEREV